MQAAPVRRTTWFLSNWSIPLASMKPFAVTRNSIQQGSSTPFCSMNCTTPTGTSWKRRTSMKSDLKTVSALRASLVTLTFDDGTTHESPVFADDPYAALTLVLATVDRQVIKALIEPCISLEDNHATN